MAKNAEHPDKTREDEDEGNQNLNNKCDAKFEKTQSIQTKRERNPKSEQQFGSFR